MPDVRYMVEHEFAVVSGICNGGVPVLVEVLSTGLRAEHFAHPACITAYAVLCAHMERTKRPMDRVTLRTLLLNLPDGIDGQKLDMEQASSIVGDIYSLDVSPTQALHHATQIIDIRTLLSTRTTLGALHSESHDWDGTGDAFLENAQKKLSEVAEGIGCPSKPSALSEIVPPWWDRFEDRYEKGTNRGSVLTGIKQLDMGLKGFPPGTFAVIGARTGEGKSAFSAQMAYYSSLSGACGKFYSLEMTQEELLERFLWRHSQVNPFLYESRKLTDDDWTRLRGAKENVATLPIEIEDQSRMSVAAFCRDARRAMFRRPLDYIVVDYLQLLRVESARKGASRAEVVGEVSHELKATAMELKVPVIAPVQLNRDNVKQKREPEKHDIREAGDIEHDADIILLLYPEDAAKAQESTSVSGVAGEPYFVKVAKFRQGRSGYKVPILFNKATMTFTEVFDVDSNF